MYLNANRFLSKYKRFYQHRHSLISTRIAISKDTPPPSPDASNDPDEHNDPVLKKVYYVDPGMMSYKRATFESLFHKIDMPLIGSELKTLAKGRKLKFSIKDDTIILVIYQYPWDDANEVIWDNMAELLSDWSSENMLRETLPILLASDAIFEGKEFITLPLKVKHHPPESSTSKE